MTKTALDPQTLSYLLAGGLGAGTAGLLTAMRKRDPGETGWKRTKRLLRNALLGGGLSAGALYGLNKFDDKILEGGGKNAIGSLINGEKPEAGLTGEDYYSPATQKLRNLASEPLAYLASGGLAAGETVRRVAKGERASLESLARSIGTETDDVGGAMQQALVRKGQSAALPWYATRPAADGEDLSRKILPKILRPDKGPELVGKAGRDAPKQPIGGSARQLAEYQEKLRQWQLAQRTEPARHLLNAGSGPLDSQIRRLAEAGINPYKLDRDALDLLRDSTNNSQASRDGVKAFTDSMGNAAARTRQTIWKQRLLGRNLGGRAGRVAALVGALGLPFVAQEGARWATE